MASAPNKQGKKLRLRRPDVCEHCRAELEAGTQAVWFTMSKTVRCLPCVQAETQQSPDKAPESTPAESTAGGSAQREYERRSARELARKQRAVDEDAEWRSRVKQKRPVLGRLAALMTEKPTIGPESQSTTAWKVGAEGERRVGDRLDELDEVLALHDLAVPNSRANIDHIAIAASGLYVIDAKKYKGEIESRNVGSFFSPDHRLFVHGRDRTKLVEGVRWQREVVREVLGPDHIDVPLHGALCFVDGDFGLVPVYFTIDSVSIVGLRKLSKTLRAPGQLEVDERRAIAALLSDRLRPAAGG